MTMILKTKTIMGIGNPANQDIHIMEINQGNQVNQGQTMIERITG